MSLDVGKPGSVTPQEPLAPNETGSKIGQPPVLDPPNPNKNDSKFENLNNTLGAVAKGLKTGSMYLGMTLKGLGKTAGGLTMGVTAGAVAIPAGVVGLAGASLTYGASRLMGHEHRKAVDHAASAAVIAGGTTATLISLLAVPVSLAAWCVKGIGIALMKPAGKTEVPKAFKTFDESFSTSILPLLGRIGKKEPGKWDTLLHKAGQEVNIKLHDIDSSIRGKKAEEVSEKTIQKAESKEVKKVPDKKVQVNQAALLLKEIDNLKTDKYDDFAFYTKSPGQRVPMENDFLWMTQSGTIFQIKNQAEGTLPGTGISVDCDTENKSVLINGKSAQDYGKEVLEKVNNLIRTINQNWSDKPDYLDDEVKGQKTSNIEKVYREFEIALKQSEKPEDLLGNALNSLSLKIPSTPRFVNTITIREKGFFLENKGNIFRMQDYEDAKEEGTGISINLQKNKDNSIKNVNILMNGKPVKGEEALELAKIFIQDISKNWNTLNFTPEQQENIDNAYLKFRESLVKLNS